MQQSLRSILNITTCSIVLGALARAFAELGYARKDIVVVTGIGCWGKADDYLTTNALHVTHGRALSFATGAKAVRPGARLGWTGSARTWREATETAMLGTRDNAQCWGRHTRMGTPALGA